MANPEHLAKLNEGADAWNQWREENPDTIPDITYTDLTGFKFADYNLKSTQLFDAKTHSVNFSGCDYSLADFWTSYHNYYFGDPPSKSQASDIQPDILGSLVSFFSSRKLHEQLRKELNSNYYSFFYRGESNNLHALKPSVFRDAELAKNEAHIMTEMMTRNPDSFTHRSHFANMATARHHDLPNRLLDVTRNPLVALFNATDKRIDLDGNELAGQVHIFVAPPNYIKGYHSDTVAMLANYCRLTDREQQVMLGKLDPGIKFSYARDKLLHFIGEEKPHFKERFNYGDFLRPFIVEPQQSIPRVRAQSGAFIISALHHRYERDEILSINDKIPCYHHYRLIVPASAKPRIRRELAMLNVTNETLMADLDASATAIADRFKSDS